MKYQVVCVAGTFDGLHRGHEAVLRAAFAAGKRVVIALTSDKYVENYKPQSLIKKFLNRKKELINWLKKHKFSKRAEIIPLDDPVGPGPIADFDALVVTRQNIQTGQKINALRKSLGKPPVSLILVPLVQSEDSQPISSTRLRNGEIDRAGNLILPDNLRPELQRPLGKIIKKIKFPKANVITVGDLTSKTFLDQGIIPNMMIIDNQVNRKPYFDLKPKLTKFSKVKVKSGPGYISDEAIKAIKAGPAVLEVKGEEDLLALPAIIYAPKGAFVYYGQPGQGMVEVKVTKRIQTKIKLLMAKFSKIT